MSHTPGPWQIELDIVMPGYPGRHAVNSPTGVIAYELSIDNARLIAAAPDLLAACKYAVANHFNIVTFGKLERAIAKAEGKP